MKKAVFLLASTALLVTSTAFCSNDNPCQTTGIVTAVSEKGKFISLTDAEGREIYLKNLENISWFKKRLALDRLLQSPIIVITKIQRDENNKLRRYIENID